MINVQNLSEEQIVKIVCNEDTGAFRELIHRYQQKLLRYANTIVNDDAKAEDVVQNSFIKAYVNLKGFDTTKSFSSWIYRIVHNEAINCIAGQKPQISTDQIIDVKDDLDIEKDFEKKELLEQLQFCLDQLPLMYRNPLSLFYLEEKSYTEISDILRIPIGTIGTRINRAKKLVRKICQK